MRFCGNRRDLAIKDAVTTEMTEFLTWKAS